jgi:hypothetical protein
MRPHGETFNVGALEFPGQTSESGALANGRAEETTRTHEPDPGVEALSKEPATGGAVGRMNALPPRVLGSDREPRLQMPTHRPILSASLGSNQNCSLLSASC